MGSDIPASSPSPQLINFFNRKRVFFLSFNGNVVMHYLTTCAHFNIFLANNSVDPLTINKSSYIMTIINPNNMAYHYQPLQQNKNMTFLHSGRVWVWVRGGYIYLCYPSRTRILKSEKTHQYGIDLDGYS